MSTDNSTTNSIFIDYDNLFSWKCCENDIEYHIETVINGNLVNCFCCKAHMARTFHKLAKILNNSKYYIINTSLTVRNNSKDKFYSLHFGDLQFGPETEQQYNKRMFDEFRVEMDRIGGDINPINSTEYELLNNNLHLIFCPELEIPIKFD